MTGKTVLITGGTGGIGKAAAIGLATMGARVGITGRDRTRAEDAAAAITRASGNPAVDVFVADMSSQAEVRRLADDVLTRYPRLDVLLNNVGGFWAHRHVTADGLEHTFALNHLAPYLLTNLLLDRLIASRPARVITMASAAQGMGTIDFDDLMGERKYSGSTAYNQSKLANVMFTYELAKRLEGTGVTATAVHPGMTSTAFSAEDPALGLLVTIMRPFMRSPARGADTAVYIISPGQDFI
jgi:NAD(P)-dependent dehydrogenase (short-subunit alcohol dehydrogenase family)